MKTKIINIDSKNIDIEKIKEAASLLTNGEVVAFPTETVYGLGANALDESAIKKIFLAKGRPSDNPLIVHINSKNELDKLVNFVPSIAEKLMDAFWPGPLTLIFEKNSNVPKIVTGGLETIAVRMPSHIVARKIIEYSLVPIAAPSANISGKPSPTMCEHVIHDLDGKIASIVCSDSSSIGLESTVLDITGEVPMILRPGGITKEMIESIVGRILIDPAIKKKHDQNLIAKSPGMKYRHYSPKADVIVFNGSKKNIVKKMKIELENYLKKGKKVGLMCTEEILSQINDVFSISLGSIKDMDLVGNKLFYVLREFDKLDIDIIFAEGFSEEGIGSAIMNRLNKSAGNNIINCD
ncbi:L-threonylcarbamoyladenylate synthase [Helicovermis profundi]|uniref:Threonylcarbamoyl-AMP synthase n=1 Tax=Helicovermis profundi TaxID=3065157 RepID=A0AAU9EDT9_9FIRM|nr:L-threonylcarbamoyladenylate synthase [Clostridia bacterium S502]